VRPAGLRPRASAAHDRECTQPPQTEARPRRTGLWFLAGLGLGLAPLLGRNLSVGAPPFSLSTRRIETFIHGNAPDSAGFGWRLPAATRSILEQSNGHVVTAIRLTLATYHGDWRQLLALRSST